MEDTGTNAMCSAQWEGHLPGTGDFSEHGIYSMSSLVPYMIIWIVSDRCSTFTTGWLLCLIVFILNIFINQSGSIRTVVKMIGTSDACPSSS